MSDSTEREAFRTDRLPDVVPDRPIGNYTAFSQSQLKRTSNRRSAPFSEEPAWWEVEEVAELPDALRWRPGSIVNSHLPRRVRIALDDIRLGRNARSSSRPLNDELGMILGDSRFGPDEDVPVWTDADTERERSSWKDEAGRNGNPRRPKRSKRGRNERPDEPRRGSDRR